MAARVYVNRKLHDNDKERICSDCLTVKPLVDFYKKLNGFSSKCILCSRKYISTWQKRTKDERRDFNKKYYAENKEKIMKRQAVWSKKDLMRRWFQSIKAIRRSNGIQIDIQWQEIKIILEKQNNVCALTGLPFWADGRQEKGKLQWDSPSLDKIDPDGGYVIENIRVIIFCVNAFKGRMNDEQMIMVAKKLIDHEMAQQSAAMERNQ